MSKSETEIKYEEYLKSDDKVKIINGEEFYKVINWYVGDVFATITIPWEVAPKTNAKLIDENGLVFQSKGLMHIRFINSIPKWYFETATIGIDVVKPNKIGEYVRIYEE